MSIRRRLLTSFFIISLMVPVASALVIGVHLYAVSNYKAINEHLLLEYSLITDTNDLVESYNRVLQVKAPDRYNAYRATKAKLEASLASLEASITDSQTKLVFSGVEHVIRRIESQTDAGMTIILSGQIGGTTQYYDESTALLPFVNEAVSSLILNELNNGAALQRNIDLANYIGLITATIAIVLLLSISLNFSISYSRQLTDPLIKLTANAKTVSPENLRLEVDPDLLERQDEVGILARSFNDMVAGLNQNVKRIIESNQKILQAKIDLEKTNTELERFSRLTVDRELTMIKLKDELKKLKITNTPNQG